MIGPFQGKYRFLSNFWGSPIEYDGYTWPTVEHAYQAAKTLEPAEKLMILRAKTPGEAKRLGRTVTMRNDWDKLVKTRIMEELLWKKFQNKELGNKLLETGDEELVELNTWGDEFWGRDFETGRGLNMLGLLLMKTRTCIKFEPNNDVDNSGD